MIDWHHTMANSRFSPFLNQSFAYAVVGATTNADKYGYRVLKDLAGAGFNVIGVNPKYTGIDGTPVYPTVADIPEKPDVLSVVVPPEVGLTILDEAKAAGISKLWFQPGAESQAIRDKAKALGLDIVTDGSCIMVERKKIE